MPRLPCSPVRSIAPVLCALLLPWLAMTSSAGPEARTDKPVFRLNVSPKGYPPYLIVSDDNRYSGIVWDVVNRIAGELNYRVVARKIPRKRVDTMLLDGYIDGTPRAIQWTDDPEQFTFTQPIVRIREVFFYPANADFHYEHPEDLRARTIITHLGYHYPEVAKEFNSGKARRFDVSNDRDMFSFLVQGNEFDAAIADLSVGQWIIRQNNWRDQVKSTSVSISDFGYRLMLRHDWKPFADAFNRKLADLKASGELEQIMDRYR